MIKSPYKCRLFPYIHRTKTAYLNVIFDLSPVSPCWEHHEIVTHQFPSEKCHITEAKDALSDLSLISIQFHSTEQERQPSSPSQTQWESSLQCFSISLKQVSNKSQTPPVASSLAPLPPRPRRPGPQTRVVHKRCPLKDLFIVSPCALSRFSHPSPGVSRGSIVEGAKTFLSRLSSVCQRNPFHLQQLSQQASLEDCFGLLRSLRRVYYSHLWGNVP